MLTSPQTEHPSPGDGKQSRKAVWLVPLVLAVLAGGAFAWQKISTPPKMVTSVKTSKTFFRMKADYTYTGKNGPQPLSFNIVAGCAIEITQYVFGASPGRSSRVPTMYALAMSDGGAIMIEIPRACGATTENGRVPKDFLPAVVQYESSEDLSLGMLYASDEAYDSPLAKLKFHGATIEKATQEEFKEFINGDEFKKNLISIKSSKDLKGPGDETILTDELRRNPRASWKQSMPTVCNGYARVKMPENVRQYLKQFWKPGDPKYWMVSADHSSKMRNWLHGFAQDDGIPNPIEGGKVEIDNIPFKKFDLPHEAWGGGMVTRDGGGSIGARNWKSGYIYSFAPEYYPYELSYAVPWVKQLPRHPKFSEVRIPLTNDHKGFMYCYANGSISPIQEFTDPIITNPDFELRITINGVKLYVQEGIVKNYKFDTLLLFEDDNYIIWVKRIIL